jgi:hypothetical protein
VRDPQVVAALDGVVWVLAQMESFARTAPSGQQTRQKSAREMVGLFAEDLRRALAEATGQEPALVPSTHVDLPEEAATVLRDHAWDLYDGAAVPRPAEGRALSPQPARLPQCSLCGVLVEDHDQLIICAPCVEGVVPDVPLRALVERLQRERFTLTSWTPDDPVFERREHLGAWVPWKSIAALLTHPTGTAEPT